MNNNLVPVIIEIFKTYLYDFLAVGILVLILLLWWPKKTLSKYSFGLLHALLGAKKGIERYDDGKIRKIYFSRKGLKVGTEKVYYRDGKINKEKKYAKGALHGIATTYYPSGQKYVVAHYANGELSGEYRIFEEDGIIKEIKKY